MPENRATFYYIYIYIKRFKKYTYYVVLGHVMYVFMSLQLKLDG